MSSVADDALRILWLSTSFSLNRRRLSWQIRFEACDCADLGCRCFVRPRQLVMICMYMHACSRVAHYAIFAAFPHLFKITRSCCLVNIHSMWVKLCNQTSAVRWTVTPIRTLAFLITKTWKVKFTWKVCRRHFSVAVPSFLNYLNIWWWNIWYWSSVNMMTPH